MKISRSRISFFVISALIITLGVRSLIELDRSASYFTSPNSLLWFGAGELGQSLLVETALATLITLLISLLSALFILTFAFAIGILDLVAGPKMSAGVEFFLNLITALPNLMLYIILSRIIALNSQSLWLVIPQMAFLISIAYFGSQYLVVQARLKQILFKPYLEGAQAIGAKPIYVFVKHIIPELYPILKRMFQMTLPQLILAEGTLSFLGLGLRPPLVTLGTLVGQGFKLRPYIHLLFFPSLVLVILLFIYDFQIRDRLEKRNIIS